MRRGASIYGTPTYSKMSSTCIGQDLSWRKPAASEAILEEMMYNSGYGKKQQVITPTEELVTAPRA